MKKFLDYTSYITGLIVGVIISCLFGYLIAPKERFLKNYTETVPMYVEYTLKDTSLKAWGLYGHKANDVVFVLNDTIVYVRDSSPLPQFKILE